MSRSVNGSPAQRTADASRAPSSLPNVLLPDREASCGRFARSNLPNALVPARGASCGVFTHTEQSAQCTSACPWRHLRFADAPVAPSNPPNARLPASEATCGRFTRAKQIAPCPPAMRSADVSRAPRILPNAFLPARKPICGRFARAEQPAQCTSDRPRSDLWALHAHRAICPMHPCPPVAILADAWRAPRTRAQCTLCPMHYCPPWGGRVIGIDCQNTSISDHQRNRRIQILESHILLIAFCFQRGVRNTTSHGWWTCS